MASARSFDFRYMWLALLALLCAPLAAAHTFSGFSAYDDEGYFTLAIRNVLAGGRLYQDVLAQHGPFYFEFWSTAFGFGALDVSTNIARGIVVGLWLLIAFVCGVAALRFTKRLAVAATVLLAVAILNYGLAAEPTHPGSLIELLLAVIALTLSSRLRPSSMWGWAGVLAGLLIMVKINMGGLAAIGLLFAAACACSSTGWTRGLQLAAGGLMVAVPFLLTAPDLDQGGIQTYASLIALSALAVVLVVVPRRGVVREVTVAQTVRPLLIGSLCAVAASALVAWAAFGADPAAVFTAVVIDASDQRDILSNLIVLPVELLDLGLIAVVAAFALRRSGMLERLAVSDHPGHAAARLLAGLAIVLSVVGGSPLHFGTAVAVFGLATPLAWVAALPRPGVGPSQAAARAGLVAVAVLQPLHAYPVAGSQLRFGSLLLLVVGGLCLGDGVDLLDRRAVANAGSRAAQFAAVAASALVIALGAKIALEQVGHQTQIDYEARAGLRPLPFSGANHVRVPAQAAAQYGALVAAVRTNCDTLQTLPGMGSLNLWSFVKPPTGLNATFWPYLLDDAQQRRVVKALAASSRPCLVRNDEVLDSITRRPIPDGALMRYLSSGWETRFETGGYKLQTPRGN